MPTLVRSPDGTIGTVAAKDLQQALDAGATQVTAEEARQEQVQAEYGGLGGQAAAAGAGLARGLTFGLSDVAGRELGYASDLEALREANPIASIGGEGVGMLAPILASGGSAAAAKGGLSLASGVRGATALPRALAYAGEGAEVAARGLLGASAESLAGKLVQKGVPMAVRGAIEGAAYGAGAEITEAALGDQDVAAEKLMAGALSGALFGGATAGGIGMLGAAAGHGLELAGRKATDAARWLGGRAASDSVAKLYSKAASISSGGEIEAIERLGIQNTSAEAREARRLAVYDAPRVRADASRSVRENLDNLMEANARITEETRGALKASYVEKAVKNGNEMATFESASQLITDANAKLRTLSWDATRTKLSGELTTLRKMADDASQYVTDAGEKLWSASNAERFVILDDVKRAFGKWTKELQPIEKSPDPFKVKVGREMRQAFEETYEGFRQHLQSEELWGKAATDQALINKNWTKQIGAEQVFEQRLTTEFGRDEMNPWAKKYVVDAAKADAYVGGLTNPNNDLTHKAVRDYVESTRDLANAVAEAYDLPAGKVVEVRRVAENAEKFRETIGKTEEALSLANQLQALRATEQGGVTALGGAAGGAMLGGPLGAAAGAALGAVTRPGQAIVQLAALERIMSRVDMRIGEGVRAFLNEAPKTARLAAGKSTRAIVPLGVYRQQAVRFTEMQANPTAGQERVRAAVGELGNAAPGITAALAAKTGAAYLALANRAPKQNDSGPFAPQHKEASDAAITSFAKYLRTVEEPLSIFDDMKKGRLSRESVDAIRDVYPRLYSQIQAKLIEEAGRMRKTAPYQKRVQLGVLFDVPTDASMTPEMFATLQATFAQGASPQAGEPAAVPKRKIDVAGAYATDAQRAEAP